MFLDYLRWMLGKKLNPLNVFKNPHDFGGNLMLIPICVLVEP